MRRTTLTLLSLFAMLSITAVVVLAAVNIKRTSFRDNGTTLTSCGTLTGLGNEDVTITITAEGVASTQCTNPGGNNPPGQQVPVSPTGTTTFPVNEIKNGTLRFCTTTQEPQVTSGQAGCPRPFTATVTDVQFSSATITVQQGGEIVLDETFTP